MKLKLLFIMSFFFVFCSTMNAQSKSQAEVIRQCVVLNKLQRKIPKTIRQDMKEILILNQGANFVFGSELRVEEKPVVLISHQDLELRKSYFLFDVLEIGEHIATVEYSFVYKKEDNDKVIVPVHLVLEKKGSEWFVLNSKIK